MDYNIKKSYIKIGSFNKNYSILFNNHVNFFYHSSLFTFFFKICSFILFK